MGALNHILLSCVEVLPRSYRKLIYQYCKMYTNYYEGSNIASMAKNGELEVIRKCIPHCAVVFDVGANQGEWAKYVLENNPRVSLHCFEPSISTFKKLVSQNFPPNVLCNNFGLSSANGKATLFIFAEGSGMNSLYRRSGFQYLMESMPLKQEKEETVSLKTLDDYCFEKNIQTVDFMKIDVEGHELEVLRGSREMLNRGHIGVIQFEYNCCAIDSRIFLKDIFNEVKELPYKFYKIFHKGVKPAVEYSQQFEDFQQSNWLLVREGHKALESLRIW